MPVTDGSCNNDAPSAQFDPLSPKKGSRGLGRKRNSKRGRFEDSQIGASFWAPYESSFGTLLGVRFGGKGGH